MTYFRAAALSEKGANASAIKARASSPYYGSAASVLANEATSFSNSARYDVFLSHSHLDAAIMYGLKASFEEKGFTVYVYWIDDAASSQIVNADTAERLRSRMKSCRSLVYATSENANSSRWMPWELGYVDGLHGKVAICPITNEAEFKGREYLSLYPVMESDLWIWIKGKPHKGFGSWLAE